MTRREPRNVPASVRDRLRNRARERGESHQLLLIRYALERFLYRLGESEYRDKLILKGGMLFALWSETPHRATKDLDLLSLAEADSDAIAKCIRQVCSTAVPADGVVFLPDAIRAEPIRGVGGVGAIRCRLRAKIESAIVPIQIDIGFGDVTRPGPQELAYPALLGYPAPAVLSYSRESMVAEKLHAIVHHGAANTRMRDYSDLFVLSQMYSFDGVVLAESIAATFGKRETAIPTSEPPGLAVEFFNSSPRANAWTAFLSRSDVRGLPPRWQEIGAPVRDFLLPPLNALASEVPFRPKWEPEGPWR